MLKNMKIATWLMLMLLLLGLMPMGTGAEPQLACFAANADADRQHGVRAYGADQQSRYSAGH